MLHRICYLGNVACTQALTVKASFASVFYSSNQAAFSGALTFDAAP